MYEINDPSEITYFIACNPLKDSYHISAIETNQHMITGQPLMIAGPVKADVIDMIYSTYVSNEERLEADLRDEEVDDNVLREITWSVGYSLVEAEATIAVVAQLMSNLSISAIKHPDREEYALPWSQYIIDSSQDGALKDAIFAKHAESISEGNVKTQSEMIADGWG